MDQDIKLIVDRITALEAKVEELTAYLKRAVDYASSDAQSSLTKSRIVLEQLLCSVYRREMRVDPPQPMIGPMLSDKAFAARIPRRMLSRMNAIRDMCNLGPHGGEVETSDAVRVMRDLIDVLEWYVKKYPVRPGELDGQFGELVERQVEMMKGFPLSYLKGIEYSILERTMTQVIGVSGGGRQEVAFRHSFPQFLDWLQAQPDDPVTPPDREPR